MQRTRLIEGQKIRDVDERIDRAQADRAQTFLQPRRARTVFHAAHQTQTEEWREMFVGFRKIERHASGAGEFAGGRQNLRLLEHAKSGGGEIARHAMHAGGVGAVRRQIDFDHRIVEAGPLRIDGADGRRVGQFDDAVALAGEIKLLERAQHAGRLDAANDALGDGDFLGGNICARWREDSFKTLARIGRAADDLHRRIIADIDHADLQLVGVGMALRIEHMRNLEARELRSGIVHMFDL